MASTNSHNNEPLKIRETTEPRVQDPPVTQIGNFFKKSADALGQHITTLGSQISNNVIDTMNTSDNPRIDKKKGTKKRSYSSRAKASKEDEEHSRCKRKKLRYNSCRDKSQMQEKRKVREVNSSESSEDYQNSCQNDDNEVGYLSLLSKKNRCRKTGELNGSLQDSSDKEPSFKDNTKVLKDTGKKNGPVDKKLSEVINTLWQQKEPVDKLIDEMGTYDPPQNCQKLGFKYCNGEIWNGHLENKNRNVDLKTQKVQKTISNGNIILGQVADSLIKIKHNKDMTASDRKKAVMPLIQMCTNGLTFPARDNNFLNQILRNYITFVLPRHMSELGKKVPEDSD